MDARSCLLRATVLLAALGSLGASYRTPNFIVTAPSPRLAQKIGQQAEYFRKNLAIEWLGRELARWPGPCPITANVAPHLGAGGATSFMFQGGQVGGWRMSIQGSEIRLLDSVLPHEVTHTIFATHFRQPLPRWADEGACTTVEHPTEKARHQRMLIRFLQTNRGIAFSRMFAMKEYPPDVLPLYAQGYSLARYLIEQGGKRKYVQFVGDGLRDENWPRALKQHYAFSSLGILQNQWLAWVRSGSPALVPNPVPSAPAPAAVLASTPKRQRPAPNLIYRVSRGRSEALPSEDSGASSGRQPSKRSALATGGWHGAGQQFAPGSISRLPGDVDVPAGPNSHQAVRQQPIQLPRQRVLP